MVVFKRGKMGTAVRGFMGRMATIAGRASLKRTAGSVDAKEQARLEARRRANSFIVALQRRNVLPKNLGAFAHEVSILVNALNSSRFLNRKNYFKRIARLVREIQYQKPNGLDLLTEGTFEEWQAISHGLDAARRRRQSASTALYFREEKKRLREYAAGMGFRLIKKK